MSKEQALKLDELELELEKFVKLLRAREIGLLVWWQAFHRAELRVRTLLKEIA